MSQAHKNISRGKVLFSYFVTYLIIITVLFLVIGSFSYSNIVRVEREKAEMKMSQAINRVVEITDANLREVLNIQSSFYTNLEVSRLRKMEANFEAKEFLPFSDRSDTLSSYTSTGQFLDRLTMYFHYNELFIASDMIETRPGIFFKLKFPNQEINYEQWREEQMQEKSGVFFVREDSTDGYVNLYYRLPIMDPIRGVTVISGLRVGELINSLGLTDIYNDSVIILTDTEGNILYSNHELARTLMHLTVADPADGANVVLDDTSYEWRSEK
ncbi:MAG TPA: hypothetical protein VFD33_07425, partial [Bacillota bacterium]|nr:hypothetical protein [Bacillota bacterium]